MKIIIVLASVFVLAICSDELLECHCMEGWLPQKDDSGALNCYGDMVKSILPCNLVQKPNCVCNEQSTSVVQDSTGTWCSRVVDGTEEKKWDCENKEDWIAFYKEHPEEKPRTVF